MANQHITLPSPFQRLSAWALRVVGADRALAEPISVRDVIGHGINPRRGDKNRIVVTVDDAMMARLIEDAHAAKVALAVIIRDRIDEAYAFRDKRR